VLYKERNLLLSSKQKLRRTQRPTTSADEFRYSKVKRSMAGIKHVLNERKKVDKILGISSAIPADYNQQSGAKSTTASK
jgi:2-oxoglutarate dehydrogenase complex dehydrogenase (E1) component-like enzyme